MNNVTFIMRGEWLEAIEMLPIEQQDKIIADIVRYGSGIELEHSNDGSIVSYVNLLKGRIDASKDSYQNKKENGKINGRKKMLDSQEVWNLAQTGMSADAIAAQLGVSKDSIYHDAGWKQRKGQFFNL
jgi:hypothetical protein